MEVVTYTSANAAAWDALVRASRNGTFLFERAFMDYHADRFADASLLFIYKGKVVGALPASSSGETVTSHGGLTYGGFIVVPETHAVDVGEMMRLAIEHYRECGFKRLVIKSVPAIYHKLPADDELYWLFRHNAVLSARGLSSAIDLANPQPFSTLRRRKLAKAQKSGLVVCPDLPLSYNASWTAFWDILSAVLEERHGLKPVHTFAEISLLKGRFENTIQLWTVTNGVGQTIAGTLLFVTHNVVHAQYIAASHEGKDSGALDLLFCEIVKHFAAVHGETSPRFLDFGISTENGGAYLNEGLIFQKEGLGGRSVVYDAYTLTI